MRVPPPRAPPTAPADWSRADTGPEGSRWEWPGVPCKGEQDRSEAPPPLSGPPSLAPAGATSRGPMRGEIPKEAQGTKWERPDPTARERKRLAHKIGTPGDPEQLSPARLGPAAQLSWVSCGAEAPVTLPTCPDRRRVHQGVRGSPWRALQRRLSNWQVPLAFLLPPPLPAAGIRRGPEGQMSYPNIKHGAWGLQISCSHASGLAGSSPYPGPHEPRGGSCSLSSPCSPTHPSSQRPQGRGRSSCPHGETHVYSWEWG